MTTETNGHETASDARHPNAAHGAEAREDALLRSVRDRSPTAADEAIDRLTDDNANVRRTAAKSLGEIGTGGDALISVLGNAQEEDFVRAAAAESLGRLQETDSLSVLREILQDPKERRSLRERCLVAICQMPAAASSEVLSGALSKVHDPQLLGRLVVEIGRLGHGLPLGEFERLAEHRDPNVRAAVARALGDLADKGGIGMLVDLTADTEPKVRRRSATALAKFPDDDCTAALARLVLLDDDESTRREAAIAVAERPPSSALLDAIIRLLDEGSINARRLDLDVVASAFAATSAVAMDDGQSLRSALVGFSLSKDRQVVEVTAAMLLGVCGRDANVAALAIDEYREVHPESEQGLLPLRVALGGQKALDPLLRRLQEDLRVYFQQPVAELNSETHRVWLDVVERAQRAFSVRIFMSLTVFILGALLVVVSASAALFGELDQTAMFGAGTSFVGGLGAMLAVTYRGPLRDVRDSVRDLGSATVLFTGYTHRVLQISHVFSAAYLRGEADLATVEQTTRLLEEASRTTSALLLSEVPGSTSDPTVGASGEAAPRVGEASATMPAPLV